MNYEKLLYLFENDDKYSIDETTFYFDDDPTGTIRYIGCLRKYEKPYWAGYCDIQNGCKFRTAEELFTARMYNNQSIKDRWEHLVLVEVGGIPVADYIRMFLR